MRVGLQACHEHLGYWRRWRWRDGVDVEDGVISGDWSDRVGGIPQDRGSRRMRCLEPVMERPAHRKFVQVMMNRGNESEASKSSTSWAGKGGESLAAKPSRCPK